MNVCKFGVWISVILTGCAMETAAPSVAPQSSVQPVVSSAAAPKTDVPSNAERPVSKSAENPAGKNPQADMLAALIAQLGDEQYANRQDAAQKIEKLGRSVLDTLKKAEKNTDDIEVRTAIQALIAKIDPPPPPEATGPKVEVLPSGRIRQTIGGMVIETDREDAVMHAWVKVSPKDGVQIEEQMNQLKVTIEEKKDAEPKVYVAGSRAEFKKKYPEIYDKYLVTPDEKKKEDAKKTDGKNGQQKSHP